MLLQEYCSSGVACKMLGVSSVTVLRLAKSGKIRGVKIGSRYKYHIQDIKDYISQGSLNADND